MTSLFLDMVVVNVLSMNRSLIKLREEFLMKLSRNINIYYGTIERHQKIYGIVNFYYLHGSMNLTYGGIERAYKGGEFLTISRDGYIKSIIDEIVKSLGKNIN